jgi:flagellar biogenesis protein FliO
MSTAVLLARFAVAVGVVMALLGLTARWMRRGRSGGQRADLEVLARRPLGRSSAVAIVRAGSSTVLVGVTDGQITMLLDRVELEEHELVDLTQADAAPRGRAPSRTEVVTTPGTASSTGTAPVPAWTAALHGLRELTVRRG